MLCVLNSSIKFSQFLKPSSKVKEINPDYFINNGFAKKSDIIKILGRGKLISKVDVSSNYFSAYAIKTIEKAGGKIKKLINE